MRIVREVMLRLEVKFLYLLSCEIYIIRIKWSKCYPKMHPVLEVTKSANISLHRVA